MNTINQAFDEAVSACSKIRRAIREEYPNQQDAARVAMLGKVTEAISALLVASDLYDAPTISNK